MFTFLTPIPRIVFGLKIPSVQSPGHLMYVFLRAFYAFKLRVWSFK